MYSIPDLVGGDRMPVSLVSQIGFPVWLVAFGSLDDLSSLVAQFICPPPG